MTKSSQRKYAQIGVGFTVTVHRNPHTGRVTVFTRVDNVDGKARKLSEGKVEIDET